MLLARRVSVKVVRGVVVHVLNSANQKIPPVWAVFFFVIAREHRIRNDWIASQARNDKEACVCNEKLSRLFCIHPLANGIYGMIPENKNPLY